MYIKMYMYTRMYRNSIHVQLYTLTELTERSFAAKK
jgi:hypothetical protein